MTAPAPAVCASIPSLQERAYAHFRANTATLGRSLPMPQADFLPGRDRSLTARRNGAWLAGCSVPRRAAELMLRTLSVRGNLACLVLPTHAHQVAVCLDRLDPGAGLIVLLPDDSTLAEMLACADFVPAIASGRLFFAVGLEDLRSLFDRFPGLPVPQQFIRVIASPADAVDAMVRSAQAVFSDVAAAQQARIARTQQASRPSPAAHRSLAVLAPTQFRLWNDTGFALRTALAADHVDLDDPRQSAVAHIAERVAGHSAVLTINVGRADRPELAHPQQPWLTYLEQARPPAYQASAPHDALILADAALRPAALRAGWPGERIGIAAPPSPDIGPSAGGCALITDLPDLVPPEKVTEFSSWRLAWETIEQELIENPTRLGADANAYLDRILKARGIEDQQLPRPLFLDNLIAPAFAIGIARLLLAAGVPLVIYGRGWDRVAGVAAVVKGPILNRSDFHAALGAAALVDVFITQPVHPIRSSGRPIVRTLGATSARIVQDARRPEPGPPPGPALAEVIARLLG